MPAIDLLDLVFPDKVRAAGAATPGSLHHQAATIGRIAQAAGVSVETIRHYHRIGLLEEPRKPEGGQRRYTRTALERIRFIRRAQELGFSLEEVKSLVGLADGRHPAETLALVERKCDQLDRWIAQLVEMRGSLERLADEGRKAKGGKGCPITAALCER